MTPFPAYYPSTIDLPFNSACLAGRFTPEPPDAAREGDVYWFLISGGELLVREDATGLQLPQGDPPEGLVAAAAPLHFGLWDGRPCRVAPVSRDLALPAGWVRESFSAAFPRLSIDLASLAALAQQILYWEKNSRHCAVCATPMTRIAGGWGKDCPACHALRFPALHPCVIVLIHRPGELLLARKAEWPAGRYGLVAGFLDFGESFEEAVIRRGQGRDRRQGQEHPLYRSQAWPFPSQIMAGFTAEYAGGELCVDRNELEDARWFSLADLPELPPPRSIARYLLDYHQGGMMTEAIAPFTLCRRRYRLAPAQIAMLRFLVEGYDGILFLSTLDPHAAIVELSWSQSCGVEAEEVLAALGRELGWWPTSVGE